MEIIHRFGELSGLWVQQNKSVLIVLNTAVDLANYAGIPVLCHGDTTRYLGYQVGNRIPGGCQLGLTHTEHQKAPRDSSYHLFECGRPDFAVEFYYAANSIIHIGRLSVAPLGQERIT